jgi:glucokinase
MSSRLVADIGGTNSRLALFDTESNEFRALGEYINSDFDSLEDVIQTWLEELAEPSPNQACLAVAAPPSGDRVIMSNTKWTFSCRAVASRFGFTRLRRINDFEANAHALPHLTPNELESLDSGQGKARGKLAVVGPGTGLGGATLELISGSHHVQACEPGSMSLAPGTELELALFHLLLQRHDNLYAELLLSGPGLTRLYLALAELQGRAVKPAPPLQISNRAVAKEDPLCVQALNTFCAMLGSACGDFVLANGAYGGLYLAGGILPSMICYLRNSEFHQRLCAKGTMQQQLNEVPIYAINRAHPGLLGAAHAPL